MKQKRCILVVDDKPQSAVIMGIKSRLEDFELDFITIRTAASELKKDDSEELDVEKLKAELRSKIERKHLYVALTDFDLECSYLNGLDIVYMVHAIHPQVKFFIYSGNWQKVIKTVVGQEYSKATIEELVEGVNKLINAKIIKCVDRIDYQEILIEYLKRNKRDSIEHRLSTLLRANGEKRFESCFPEFKGMSFKEIADRIDSCSDARTDEWIEAILTQTIAYLNQVNK